MGAPALHPPDGPDVNIGEPMLRVIWILNGTTFIVVLLRLYTQGRIIRQLGVGDALMAASLVTLTAMVSTITIQYRYGLGRHFFFLDSHQKVQAIKFSFVTQPLGVMAPAFGRMATCAMMLQLFGTTRIKKWALWFTLWSQLIVNLVVCLLIFVQCKDVRTLWDPNGHPGYCWRPIIQEYTGYAQGAINASADLLLTVLPISIFWTLKITKTLKCGLGILLGLSGIAFVASIVKTVLLKAIGERGDFTFGTVNFFKWVVYTFRLRSLQLR
ncbi:hypothetical protein BKA61DRAFT_733178 [Leptodontidium sp. MPI-SDFR-AT-0119]|nr:hypothetical protein BKA61DRAFT_733178 [Leptodontidium sp. MPI-SDFR-AT-0119]